MENSNSGEEDKMHTASGVTEGLSQDRMEVDNEAVESFRRGGRKGRSVAARLAGKPDGSPAAAQTAQGLPYRSTLPTQEQHRVVISREANEQLEKVVAQLCEGLDVNAISRSDLANYVFLNISKLLSLADFKALRAIHFDERKVLSSILKSAEELPEEIRKAIREHYGLVESAKKKSTRMATELSTEPSVDNSDRD